MKSKGSRKKKKFEKTITDIPASPHLLGFSALLALFRTRVLADACRTVHAAIGVASATPERKNGEAHFVGAVRVHASLHLADELAGGASLRGLPATHHSSFWLRDREPQSPKVQKR